jgi:Family of unknown function (DUF5316)
LFNIFIAIGILFIFISGLGIGAWVNGPQQRANFHSETKEQRDVRVRFALYSGAIGFIFIGLAITVWFL